MNNVTGVGVDKEESVSAVQVMDHRSLGQICHVSHILQKFVLWRVLGLNLIGLVLLDLSIDKSLNLDLAVLFAKLFTLKNEFRNESKNESTLV